MLRILSKTCVSISSLMPLFIASTRNSTIDGLTSSMALTLASSPKYCQRIFEGING